MFSRAAVELHQLDSPFWRFRRRPLARAWAIDSRTGISRTTETTIEMIVVVRHGRSRVCERLDVARRLRDERRDPQLLARAV